MKNSRWRAMGCALSLFLFGLSVQAFAAPLGLEPAPVVRPGPEAVSLSAAPDSTKAALDRISAQREVSAFGFPCGQSLFTRSLPGALIGVELRAPCRPGERVRLSQDGMHFDLTLPNTGEVSLTIPALGRDTVLGATFENGDVVEAATTHKDMPEFVRIALQSDAPGRIRLRAQAPRRLPVDHYDLGDGTGAVMNVLSHHVDPARRGGVIRLSLLSSIDPEGCALPRHGQIAELPADGPPRRYAVQLVAPGCNRLGEIQELKNVVADLKLPKD